MRRKIGLREVRSEPALETREEKTLRRKRFLQTIIFSSLVLLALILLMAFVGPGLGLLELVFLLVGAISVELIFYFTLTRSYPNRLSRTRTVGYYSLLAVYIIILLVIFYLVILNQ